MLKHPRTPNLGPFHKFLFISSKSLAVKPDPVPPLTALKMKRPVALGEPGGKWFSNCYCTPYIALAKKDI